MSVLHLKRFGLVLLSLLLAILVLEVGHRLLAATLRSAGYRAERSIDAKGRLVLCVGDSHTYGTSIPRELAYPAQLEAYLNRVDPDGRYTVVNRGIPGLNSAQLAGLLPGWLQEYRPDLVVVWIGANNWWNREDPARVREGGDNQGVLLRILSWSRLYRVWHTFQVNRELGVTSEGWDGFSEVLTKRVQASLGKEGLSDADFLRVTLDDLRLIGDGLRDSGREWLLVTYPQPHPTMKLQARAATQVARGRKLEIVHTPEDYDRALAAYPDATIGCPSPLEEGHQCLYVNAMGPHPTGILFRFIAESIGARILSILDCAGACDPAAP